MAAYEADPTPENLQRATDAYETYQQTCANSMQAYDELVNGNRGIISSIQDKNPGNDNSWIPDQAEAHRRQADEMDAQMDVYNSF